jgi:uncharacterized membrane protein
MRGLESLTYGLQNGRRSFVVVQHRAPRADFAGRVFRISHHCPLPFTGVGVIVHPCSPVASDDQAYSIL